MIELLTTRQVCELLGVTRQTLYDWGALPDLKAPGANGTLGWQRATVQQLGHDHGRHHLCGGDCDG